MIGLIHKTEHHKTEQHNASTAAALASGYASLIGLFQSSVQAHGFRTAVVCGQQRMTYVELNRAANRMADRLQRIRLRHGDLAALYVDRSVDMIVALLGILKCGAAYLPIDPGYPVTRVLETLADARPAVLITTKDLASKLPKELEQACEILLLDEWTTSELDGSANPPQRCTEDDVAYVIYTSGSTGKPKGVQVSHRNVARLIGQTQRWFHFDERDTWTMFHSLAFDFSVWEIWGCLLTGGRLVIVPFEISRSPEEFYMLLSEQRVTVLNQTPSAFSLLMHAEETRNRIPLSLRLVIFGGEALYPRRLTPWFERHGDTTPQLINMYGITETTVHVSYRPITARDATSESESLIGVPIPDLQIHVLDEAGQPVDEGETGEMYIGGSGVAIGYLNRPSLNQGRFIPDPFRNNGARLYRTGDLARRRADGELVYLGRMDGQVKINGFRIELGEVEAALAGFPDIQQSCVVTRADASGNQRLAAYFVPRKQAAIEVSALSAFLASRLPAQMLPSFYTQIESLPLTGNGKLDRAALPAPGAAYIAEPAPLGSDSLTEMEQKISAAWCEALNLDHVRVDDNFFDIGGTSILLIKVRSVLQAQLDRAIPITWMFEWTNIRKLAAHLEATAVPEKDDDIPVVADLAPIQTQANKQRDAFARIRSAMGGGR